MNDEKKKLLKAKVSMLSADATLFELELDKLLHWDEGRDAILRVERIKNLAAEIQRILSPHYR